MTYFDIAYKNLLQNILETGAKQEVRGEETVYLLNQELSLDLMLDGFPSLTLRNSYPKSALNELQWLLTGQGDISKIKSPTMAAIWKEYANPAGVVQFSYYDVWRSYNGVDQLTALVKKINYNPHNRGLVVTMYNPEWLNSQPPCQASLCFSATDDSLNLTVFARSADAIFGLPSDIQVYAGLLKIISSLTNKLPKRLSFFMVNAHVYSKHIGLASRLINQSTHWPAPQVSIYGVKKDFSFSFQVENYKYEPFNMNNQRCLLGDLSQYTDGRF